MKHLRQLAEAGVTHVHLLPVFDIATVPERRADQAEPDCDLAVAAARLRRSSRPAWPRSPTGTATTGATTRATTRSPRARYATDPDGPARIVEFRQMVAGAQRAPACAW